MAEVTLTTISVGPLTLLEGQVRACCYNNPSNKSHQGWPGYPIFEDEQAGPQGLYSSVMSQADQCN